MKKLLNNRIFMFIICGAVTAAFNILLITFIIKFMRFDKPILRNIANIVSIEISLIFSFFVYRTWVWSKGNWVLQEVLWRQIPLYHLSCGFTILVRSIIIFPVLDWLGVNYVINTLVGILLGASVNYFVNDKWVFNTKKLN